MNGEIKSPVCAQDHTICRFPVITHILEEKKFQMLLAMNENIVFISSSR